MKKILVVLFCVITISLFATVTSSNGNEICINNGECYIEGMEIDVKLRVPKTLTVIKSSQSGEADFDFGDVFKGSDATAETKFKIKGDIESLKEIKTYQNNIPVDKIVLNNGNSVVEINIDSITRGTHIQNSDKRDELDINMRLKVSGEGTKDLASGEYRGTFTIRAILGGQGVGNK